MDDYQDIFRQAVARFAAGSSEEQRGKFETANRETIEAQLMVIQSLQEPIKDMINLNRFEPILQALGQFDEAIKALDTGVGNASHYIWGPLRLIFEFAKDDTATLNAILTSYHKFGRHMPLVSEYGPQLTTQDDTKICLALMYDDLLKFNFMMLDMFKTPSWKKIFMPNWISMQSKHSHFNTLLLSFDAHSKLLRNATDDQLHRVTREMNQTLNDHIMQYHRDREQILQDAEKHLEIERRIQYHEVTRWLKSPGEGRSERDYQDANIKARKGYEETGTWFLEEDVIRDWIEAEMPELPILWVHGEWGTGKTILASVLIQHLLDEQSATRKCSYFYCNENQSNNPEPRVLAIKKSLLRQILAHNQELLPTLHEKATQGQSNLGDEKTADSLLELFCETDMNQFIVIDGLDELKKDDRKSVLQHLEAMVVKGEEQGHPEKIRVMILSTDLPAIRERLAEKDRVGQYEIVQDKSKKDIELYVSKKVEDLSKDMALEEDVAKRVIQETCEKSQGMMLYATLVMENLSEVSCADDVSQELDEGLPTGIKEAYEEMFKKMEKKLGKWKWKAVLRIFGWLSHAKRPLKLYEINAATSINVNADSTGDEIKESLRLRKPVEEICGSLVRIVGRERVEFSHSMARRFILEKNEENGNKPWCDMLVLCLRYLSHQCFEKSFPAGDREKFVKKGLYAFQDYAISEWFEHLRDMIQDGTNILQSSERPNYWFKICKVLQAFYTKYRTGLEALSEEQRGQDAEISAEAIRECEAFAREEFYQPLLVIWKHVLRHHKQHNKKASQVSIEELGEGLKETRKVLEGMHDHLDDRLDDRLDDPLEPTLRKYYGNHVFKCTRATCAFFYEGFEGEKAREHHNYRHDRNFFCEEQGCHYRTFGFISNQDRNRHYRTRHIERAAQAMGFPDLSQSQRRRDPKFQCDDCPKSFTRKAALKAHVDCAHLMRRPYPCSTCGREFVRKNDRRRHEKLHVRRRRD